MSRGERQYHSGNLSNSMRQNYSALGVPEYYKQVGATYRNPHLPGIRQCLYHWFTRWWTMEQTNLVADPTERILIFDMACGSGEATLVFREWWKVGKQLSASMQQHTVTGQDIDQPPPSAPSAEINATLVSNSGHGAQPRHMALIPEHRKKRKETNLPPLGPEFPRPLIVAADPYTSAAYTERTTFPCSNLSFRDIAEGVRPTAIVDLTAISPSNILLAQPPASIDTDDPSTSYIEMVVCSFALHLVESPSELFSLLWELSTKARWLVILAPHKKPEIKNGWGWVKWNISEWKDCIMPEHEGELLYER